MERLYFQMSFWATDKMMYSIVMVKGKKEGVSDVCFAKVFLLFRLGCERGFQLKDLVLCPT